MTALHDPPQQFAAALYDALRDWEAKTGQRPPAAIWCGEAMPLDPAVLCRRLDGHPGIHQSDGGDAWGEEGGVATRTEPPRFVTELPGWPRRHAPCADDESSRRLLGLGVATDRPATRPVPWLAQHDSDGRWSAYEFAGDRALAMREDDLCQLCGGPRGAAVFTLASERPDRAHRKAGETMYGGALCSLRCARLVAAVCPHYVQMWPVGIYEVPMQPRVDFNGCGEDNDDEYDVRGLDPVAVVGHAGTHASDGGDAWNDNEENER